MRATNEQASPFQTTFATARRTRVEEDGPPGRTCHFQEPRQDRLEVAAMPDAIKAIDDCEQAVALLLTDAGRDRTERCPCGSLAGIGRPSGFASLHNRRGFRVGSEFQKEGGQESRQYRAPGRFQWHGSHVAPSADSAQRHNDRHQARRGHGGPCPHEPATTTPSPPRCAGRARASSSGCRGAECGYVLDATRRGSAR